MKRKKSFLKKITLLFVLFFLIHVEEIHQSGLCLGEYVENLK